MQSIQKMEGIKKSTEGLEEGEFHNSGIPDLGNS